MADENDRIHAPRARDKRAAWAHQLEAAADTFGLTDEERSALRELAKAIRENRP